MIPLAAIDWSSILGQIATGALSVFVVPLVLFLLPKIPAFTKSAFGWVDGQSKKVHNEYIQGVLQRLSLLVQANVLAAEQTQAADIKQLCADGKITKEEMNSQLAKVKAEVLQKVKEAATVQKLWDAGLFVFANNEGELSKWIDTVTEAHVNSLPPSVSQAAVATAAVSSVAAAVPK